MRKSKGRATIKGDHLAGCLRGGTERAAGCGVRGLARQYTAGYASSVIGCADRKHRRAHRGGVQRL